MLAQEFYGWVCYNHYTGRWNRRGCGRLQQGERLFVCGGVLQTQTERHVVQECPMTHALRISHFNSIEDLFSDKCNNNVTCRILHDILKVYDFVFLFWLYLPECASLIYFFPFNKVLCSQSFVWFYNSFKFYICYITFRSILSYSILYSIYFLFFCDMAYSACRHT
ncbi:hypothetical protein E2C01_092835 [Portunus trituberculatus]|uniref:Uncharacterized protein n=1 Tax=Portunus trituberculatus TaxID=210409 RepID=A0A5B7JWH7_PORTR|nr:hypothetical protein [Portunus trituberculatus]